MAIINNKQLGEALKKLMGNEDYKFRFLRDDQYSYSTVLENGDKITVEYFTNKASARKEEGDMLYDVHDIKISRETPSGDITSRKMTDAEFVKEYLTRGETGYVASDKILQYGSPLNEEDVGQNSNYESLPEDEWASEEVSEDNQAEDERIDGTIQAPDDSKALSEEPIPLNTVIEK